MGDKGSTRRESSTAAARADRDARLVADRGRGLGWTTLAEKYGLTARQCQNIWAAREPLRSSFAGIWVNPPVRALCRERAKYVSGKRRVRRILRALGANARGVLSLMQSVVVSSVIRRVEAEHAAVGEALEAPRFRALLSHDVGASPSSLQRALLEAVAGADFYPLLLNPRSGGLTEGATRLLRVTPQ